ncbi:MAG: diguanylate cyclase [Planctomycetota bacterium]
MRQTRVLLTEDDTDQQRLLLRAIANGERPVSVSLASTAAEAIDLARCENFDCLVLDYNLPLCTAPELLREIEPLQPGVPVVVISASECQEVVINSIRGGVADFVPKHDALRGDMLWNRVQAAITNARAERCERRRINRRLKQLESNAHRDPLTKLCNRRGMELAMEARRAPGASAGDRRQTAAVFLIDLDHFKRVNDQIGHNAGDAVLRDAANVIRSACHDADIAARWGGEEFLVIRPSVSLVHAFAWAEQVRRRVEQEVRLPGTGEQQTASIGVDVVPSGQVTPGVLSRVDRAMYLAKDAGRNRVRTWCMVEAMDLAHEIGSIPGTSAHDRVCLLVQRLRRQLGPTQLEHVGVHGTRVNRLVMDVAGAMFDDPEALADIALAAEFHDLGKVAIPESLLAMPRRLSAGERCFVDEHARFGADLFEAIGASHRAIRAVELHHRRFDATGTIEPQPPRPSEVLNACDALVTMLSDRPYARARPPEQAMAELRAERGRQFHPDVVDLLHVLRDQHISRAA